MKVVNAFYAAPVGLGELDLSTAEGRGHPDLVAGPSYEAVLNTVRSRPRRRTIREWKRAWRPVRASLRPVLGERIYGALTRVRRNLVPQCEADPEVVSNVPILVSRYKDHNIVKVYEAFYAAPVSLGHLDLSTANGRNHPDLLVAPSYEIVLEMVRSKRKRVNFLGFAR